MESLIADISDLKVEEKYNRFRQIANTLVALHIPECEKAAEGKFMPEDVWDFIEKNYDEKCEQGFRKELAEKIPEAELEDVQLQYIPDYIRELDNKTDYWRKEFQFWNDEISKKNWHKYEEELNVEMMKLKTVIKNLDKYLLRTEKMENHLSHSLDPERVQTLVDYIKEKENNNRVLVAMLQASFIAYDFVQHAYIQFAIYARYGEFRLYPSRPDSWQVKKED